jgi:hypothetical protein
MRAAISQINRNNGIRVLRLPTTQEMSNSTVGRVQRPAFPPSLATSSSTSISVQAGLNPSWKHILDR